MNNTYYIGLDVHKESVAIAHALEGSRQEAQYYGTCRGSVQNTERTLRKLARKLEVEFKSLKVCYEAGPTGFVLARRLIRLGLDCIVIAPTKTERKPNERIKTDRRDACKKLAKLFRNGDLVAVYGSRRPATRRCATCAGPAPMRWKISEPLQAAAEVLPVA